MQEKPKFDPNKPFTPVSNNGPDTPVQEKPKFDPTKEFKEVKPSKKKDESTLPDGSVSSEPAAQPQQPSEQPTASEQENHDGAWDAVGVAIEQSQGALAKGIYDFVRRAWSGVTDDIPKAMAQGLEVAKSSVSPKDIQEYIQNQKSVDFQKYVREKEGIEWYKPFDQSKYLDKYAESFMKDTGRQYIAEKIKHNEPNVVARRQKVEQYVQQQNKEALEKTGGAIQDYRQIKSIADFASYVGSLGGQALSQIPLAIVTRGGSSLVMESATVYDQQLDNIAKEKGMTRAEVIAKGLDKPAEGQAYAVLAAALDATSAGNIVSAFRKQGGSIATKWAKSAIPESGTEVAQGILERTGAGSENIIDAPSMINEAAGGLIGGSVGAFGPTNVVKQEQAQMNPEDLGSVERAAENIQEKIEKGQNLNTNETEQITPEGSGEVGQESANQQQSTGTERESSGGDATIGETKEIVQDNNLLPNESSQITTENKTSGDVQTQQSDELTSLREKIINSPEDLKWDGNKVTILTEKGAEMLRQYDALKNQPPSTEGEIGANQTSESDEKGRQEGRQEELLNPTEQTEVKPESAPLTTEENDNLQQGRISDPDSGSGVPQATERGNQAVGTSDPSKTGITPDSDGESASGNTVQSESNKTRLPGNKQTRLGERIEQSQEPEEIKEKVKGRDTYVPRQIIKTNEEAKQILDTWTDAEAEAKIRDTSNEMPGGTRATLAANLYERYKASDRFNEAADIAVWAAQNLTKSGQETAIAGKIWKSIMSNEDLTVLALEKQNYQEASRRLAPIRDRITVTRDQLDAQIRQAVTEQVEKRLKGAKLISDQKRKQIADAFDRLKVKDVQGAANDITRVLGAAVWNGSIEAVKRAVLTGADVANAIQAGIDYIRQNHKGEWSQDEYRNAITPAVEQMIPKEKITRDKIDDEKITTPNLSRKRKKQFIDDVVEAYNEEGKISDQKFDELYAKQLGVKPFSPEERTQIRSLAKIISEVENFKDELKNNFTEENLQKYKDLLKRAQAANKSIQEFAQKNPSDVWSTLSTILQGNILTPLSIIRNVYSNTAYQPLRFFRNAIAQPIDIALTELAKTNILGERLSDIIGKERTIDIAAAQKGYMQGGWNGLMEGLYQMKTGVQADERNLRDIQSNFDPARAIKRWAEEDRTAGQKINDAIEGTFGWPAETMFRLLNLGDKPFRHAAELARGFELGALKGLKGKDLIQFVTVPDTETQAEMDAAGKEATFQNETRISQAAQWLVNGLFRGLGKIPVVGGPARFVAKTQIPFVKTPANLLSKALEYAVWPITMLHGAHQISRGNKRQGSLLIGDALVGAMITTVSYKLLEMGLMTFSPDDEEKRGKTKEAKSLQYETEPPNSLNVSAIQRGLSGQGFEKQDDDVWVDYKNLGIQGIVMQIYANTWYHDVKDGKEPFHDMLSEAGLSGIKTASSALDQSFLQGTNTLLNAIQDPEGHAGRKWMINTTEAITAIAAPRVLTSTLQAHDDYIRDTQDEKFVDQLRNTYKSKFLMGDDLPARVNLWGEKITGNPEGRNRYVYYLFDPTRFREVDQDSYKYKIYQAWKDSKFDDAWLPSSPNHKFSHRGIEKRLTPKEYELLSTEIGQARARKVAGYMARTKKPDLERIKELYSDGYAEGKRRFLMTMGWNVLRRYKEASESKEK